MKSYAPEKLELAPRDVVSRSMIKEIDNGKGFIHETGVPCLKLDLTHLGEERIKEKLAGIREIGIKFSGVDITNEPIEIRPVCHYMMGGIHTNIDGQTEMNGLWCAGEAACNSLHGANRLGANSTSECLVWGTITGKLAAQYAEKKKESRTASTNLENKIQAEEKRIYDGIFRGKGEVNPYEIRKEFTDMMDVKAYIFRDEKNLVEGLKKVRELRNLAWKRVDDSAKEYNTNFINVMEIDSLLRVGEIIIAGALNRKESRGAHSRTDYPNRDDVNFLKHTLAHYKDDSSEPQFSWHPVTLTRYVPAERKY
jgi:succinate dehydrogenase / fumarate reductase flavoprotein subunit